MKKRKAFDQRGDMAIAAWAEQQQRELNLRARRLAKSKVPIMNSKKLFCFPWPSFVNFYCYFPMDEWLEQTQFDLIEVG